MRRLLLLAFFFVLIFQAKGQEFTPNINDLVDETQRTSSASEEINLVWWIPVEFWEISLQNDPSMTKAQLAEFINVLENYTMIGVIDGKIGAFGGITYTSREDIQKNLNIISTSGKKLVPLWDDDIDPDAQNLISMLKPVFANMLGNMGENLQMYMFSGYEDGKVRVADPTEKGNFVVNLKDIVFDWKLPLGSLMPPKKCPEDGEMMSGNWSFCPWHGKALE
ncbi:MAG: hypothetical protein JXQ96_06860 [Cyclobacteriaceae bacterium]